MHGFVAGPADIYTPEWVAAIGTWVGAVGTIFGTLVIGFGLLVEVRRRRRDGEQAAAERREGEADQARLISVNYTLPGTEAFAIDIINDSDGPIRRVTITLCVFRDGLLQRAKTSATLLVAAHSTHSALMTADRSDKNG